MSNTRDNVIDLKQKELYEKKDNLIKKIHDLPKYKTNLIYNDNSKSFNLRAVNSIDKLQEVYFEIYKKEEAAKSFSNMLKDVVDVKPTAKVCGFFIEDWLNDIKTIAAKISYTEKLNAINDALNNIEKFYSDERKEENAFNSLLSDIENL